MLHVSFVIFVSLAFALSFLWYSLIRISRLHNLEIRCMAEALCPKLGAKSWKGFVLDFFYHYTLLPVGIFRGLWGVVWRPWWYVLYIVPMSLIGEDLISDVAFWEMREVLLGTVLWLCMITFNGFRMGPRTSIYAATVLSWLLSMLVFYLTAEPVVWFWVFMVVCFTKPFTIWFLGQWPSKKQMQPEEWVAFVFTTWWFCRYAYINANSKVEEWSARQEVKASLQRAINHPFFAELESGFGFAGSDLDSEPEMVKKVKNFLGYEAEVAVKLKDKRKLLVERKMSMLQEESAGAAALPSKLRLTVRRDHLLEDTWNAIYDRRVSELMAPDVKVSFEEELGADAGGVTRDWFDSVARRIAENASDVKGDSLLALAPDNTLIPRPIAKWDSGAISEDHQAQLRAFLALGRFLALAVVHERQLPVSFSTIACKHFLRLPVGMEDLKKLDPDFYKFRVAPILKRGGVAELNETLAQLGDEPLTFRSAPTELRPEPEDLKYGGSTERVTEENKHEYVQLLCEAYLCGGIRRELQCMLTGFWHLLPPDILREVRVTPWELSALISGICELDVMEWRAFTQLSHVTPAPEAEEWFWGCVLAMNPEQRAMLLHFTTGSSRLPLGGFPELSPAFTLHISAPDDEECLPTAQTCINQLMLPKYQSEETLNRKLLQAISCDAGFGFL